MKIILTKEKQNEVYLEDIKGYPSIIIGKSKNNPCFTLILVRVDGKNDSIPIYKWRNLFEIHEDINASTFTSWREAVISYSNNYDMYCFYKREEFLDFLKNL